MSERTDGAILLRFVYQAMRNAGLPAETVLMKAGIGLNQVEARARTPSAAQNAFWQAVASVSEDPDIGLHLGEHLPLYRGQVLEYLFLSSSSFGGGLRRVMAYQRLISDLLQAKLVYNDDECYFVNLVAGFALRHTVECLMVGVLRFFRFVSEGQFQPVMIEFTHDTGATPEEYERVYGCPVILGASEIRLHFKPEVLSYPIWQAEPELLRFHEQLAHEKLQELARFDLVAEVRRAVGETLESGTTSLETVATRLGIPPRRLRTQLTDAGTSFNQVLADYRCRLAKRLLAHTGESIEQIVYLTGFSEPSTFYRAFKRWTGLTPIEYRKKKQA
jgi:AraC-like DNA-binding protein